MKSILAANEPVVSAPVVLVFLNTETVLLLVLVTIKSDFPSPSISPMATLDGTGPVAKSTLVANEPAVIAPVMLVFLNTETVALPEFATTNSGFPSPSRSPMATLRGSEPVVKSTLAAKELVVIAPVALVFLNTETTGLLLFATAKSGFPSPSRSPMATSFPGVPPVVKSTLAAKELTSKIPALGKVTINGALE